MKLLITGASGLIGSAVLQAALDDPQVTAIILALRKPIPVSDTRIRQVIVQDFMQASVLADAIREADALVWCLGISQTQVSRAENEKITYHFTF